MLGLIWIQIDSKKRHIKQKKENDGIAMAWLPNRERFLVPSAIHHPVAGKLYGPRGCYTIHNWKSPKDLGPTTRAPP